MNTARIVAGIAGALVGMAVLVVLFLLFLNVVGAWHVFWGGGGDNTPTLACGSGTHESDGLCVADPATPTDGDQPAPTQAPAGGGTTTSGGCRSTKDYQLQDLPEVATSGSHIRVQFWDDGTPGEKETFLPASAADGGRFILTQPLKGHVWEFDGCTDQQMLQDANATTQRRLAGHADNKGYVEWTSTGLFQPSGLTQIGTAAVQPPQVAAIPAPAAGCDGVTEIHQPVAQAWTPSGQGGYVVVNTWSNWPGYDQTVEYTVLLGPGDLASFNGGGDATAWSASCQQAAQDGYNNSSYNKTTLADLISMGRAQ